MMREHHGVIVGMGPRGLSLLEQINRCAGDLRVRLVLHLVDPGETGQGSHPSEQPAHLLVNTLASQITMFSLLDPDNPGAGNRGPSLTEWARSAGYRRFGNVFARVGAPFGLELDDDDYLPRSILGEYLSWFYDELRKAAPANVRYVCHRRRAADLTMRPDGRWVVHLDNGYPIPSDFVFIAVGHCNNRPNESDQTLLAFVDRHAQANSRLGFYKSPYPIEGLSSISPDATVAIMGLGLTAHDVISALTVGRGGHFAVANEKLEYVPSGREPRMWLFSRNSLPSAARGINQKGIAGRHEARFFTVKAVQQLRAEALRKRGSPQLDFDAELLPLLKLEMCFAMSKSRQGDGHGMPFEPTAADMEAVDGILFPLRNKRFATLSAFRSYIYGFLHEDLAEAMQGNLRSPIKAATDVIRDAREALCAAAEYHGLTPDSHRSFVESFIPLMNRVAFGPPRYRNMELIALMRAGIIDWGGGPGAQLKLDHATNRFVIETVFAEETARIEADVLIKARLDAFLPEEDSSAFISNLLRRGWIRPFRNGSYHPGGIDIDDTRRPFGKDGRPLQNVWVVGYPAEGPHFYTYALPRPARRSRSALDADRCVQSMLDAIGAAVEPIGAIASSVG